MGNRKYGPLPGPRSFLPIPSRSFPARMVQSHTKDPRGESDMRPSFVLHAANQVAPLTSSCFIHVCVCRLNNIRTTTSPLVPQRLDMGTLQSNKVPRCARLYCSLPKWSGHRFRTGKSLFSAYGPLFELQFHLYIPASPSPFYTASVHFRSVVLTVQGHRAVRMRILCTSSLGWVC